MREELFACDYCSEKTNEHDRITVTMLDRNDEIYSVEDFCNIDHLIKFYNRVDTLEEIGSIKFTSNSNMTPIFIKLGLMIRENTDILIR